MLSFCRGSEFSWFGQVTQKPKPLSVFSVPPEEGAFPPPYALVRPMVTLWRKNSSPSWGEEGSFSLLPRASFLLHMWSRFGYKGSGRNFPGAEEALSLFLREVFPVGPGPKVFFLPPSFWFISTFQSII